MFILVFSLMINDITNSHSQTSASSGAMIERVYTDLAMYDPDSTVTISVEISNSSQSSWSGDVDLSIYHLESEVYNDSESVQIAGQSDDEVTFTWTTPNDNFKGYFVEVTANDTAGYSAIDVSTDWTKYPRYGFFSEYTEAQTYAEAAERVSQTIQNYHTNAFQLYDWMWRHDTFIQRDEHDEIEPIWEDWSGKLIYWETVQNLIQAIQDQNAAAMPYTMSYAAYDGYGDRTSISPEWGMYHDDQGENQLLFDFGDNDPNTTMWLFHPANADWQDHMYDEYLDIILTAGFDGIHLDQLGQRGGNYDYFGNSIDEESSFTPFVNNLRSFLDNEALGDKAVTFNMVDGAVDGWTVDEMTNYANTSFDYAEIWGDAPTYLDLNAFVEQAREQNNGKALVLAAYLNYQENTGERYEAEDATLINVGTNNNHSGYTGTGFVDQFGETDDAVEFDITVPEDGQYSFVFRFANDTGLTATRSVYLNDTKIDTINFLDQDGWDDWEFDAYTLADLMAGNHTVKLQVDSTDSGYINLDSLTLGTFEENSVRLANAAIAASGAFHIEMGEGDQMLTHPYFPNRSKQMRSSLQQGMIDHYNFITAYENLLFDHEVVPNDSGSQFVQITGESVSGDASAGTIWTNLKRSQDYNIMHMINLTNNSETSWRFSKNTPDSKTNLATKYYIGGSETITNVYVASPDIEGGKTEELSFTSGQDGNGNYIEFTVPSLDYWNMIYMKRTFDDPQNGIYEAEDAVLTNVGVNDNHSGYTGTGFVDDFYQTNNGVSFTVNTNDDEYNLRFRYSNGGTNATRDIFINGNYHDTVTFNHTGGWDQWVYADTNITLREGFHSVIIWQNATNAHAINLDHLKVE